ncbi:MAG: PKD domain-containing protein [Bacteroidota bacterium]
MKVNFTLLFLVVSLMLNDVFTQSHDHYWPMGYGSFSSDTTFGRTVIDFNESPPMIYREDRDLEFSSTVASYCDSLGNLLFYTNGIRLIGNEHETVENGDSLNTGPFALSDYWSGYKFFLSEVFIPLPDSPDSLLLIHISSYPDDTLGVTGKKLHRTTIVNNDGNNYVAAKNQPLLEDVKISSLTMVKHANGRDWWVFSGVGSQNRYFSFLLNPEGFSSLKEFELTPAFPFLYASSYLTFSPDGSKMARYYVTNGVYIYDFDRCTGKFENPVFIPMPNTTLGAGISISPNSRFLYITSALEVFQFDLWADDIALSMDTVAVYDGHTSPFGNHSTFLVSQLGPDGRIYINSPGTSNVLHAVQYPNKKGQACELRQHGVQLPTYYSFTMPHFPNYRLGPLDGSPCDTLGLDNVPVAKFRYEQDSSDYLQVEFTDLSHYEPAEWSWDFGDNTTSQDTSPVHTFPQDGAYEVCLTVVNLNGEHTFCRTLEIGTVSSVEEIEKVDITVFPNPCREGVNIIISDYLPRDARVVLYDVAGQRLKSQSIQTGWNTLRLESIRPGIYFYEIWEGFSPGPASGEVLLESGKLVKVE